MLLINLKYNLIKPPHNANTLLIILLINVILFFFIK